MRRITELLSLLAVAAFCLGPLQAQRWRTEAVPEAGVRFDIPDRLERLPMRFGADSAFHRARLRPKDNQDFVRAQYTWYCDVYEWPKKQKAGGGIELPEGLSEEDRKKIEEMVPASARSAPKSFEEWLREQDKATIKTSGKKKRGRNGKLDYEHWVWLLDNDYGPVGQSYCEAAVYDFEDRQVALVILMPLEKKNGKPKRKWARLIDKMIKSGRAIEEDARSDDSGGKKDRYADADWKREQLERAKANIAGLQGWDYFTMPNYIVLYSWDFEHPQEKGKSRKQARFYAERLEKMRELYMRYYPLDETGTKAVLPDPDSLPGVTSPVTGPEAAEAARKEKEEAEKRAAEGEKLGTLRYSVFRLCATYDQFRKYGSSPPGVVGWFSPASKELVVFLGGDKMMGAGATETVTFHEGWHQYADFYFDHPDRPKKQPLHRWFDEAHGDFFGSFRWGAGGWKYKGSKMRYASCRQMVQRADYVPFKEIVRWDRRRFYSQKAAYYYAQAYSMIDFLRRGEKSHGWDPRWGRILDTYRKVMLLEGDRDRAVDLAFYQFTDEDWQRLEEAWKAWVSSSNFKKG